MRALISVYYKEGVEELARVLQELGYEIVASSSTAKYLREKGIEPKDIEQITNFPEILSGRVKTLHPFIHGGILMRDWVEEDKRQIQSLGIEPIDVVVVNLYPFEEKLLENLEEKELMEFVDIGGPTLIRSGAKNFYRVLVVCDAADYGWVTQKLKEKSLTLEDRKYLAVKAFSLTAYYDALISNALADLFGISEMFSHMAIPLKLTKELRYGENPHQRGWLFRNPLEAIGIANSEVLQGKEMSFNNYLDADSALKLAFQFERPACVIVKHNNPCGTALGETPSEAFLKAKETDPESAFGGIVAFNCKVDQECAKLLTEMFLEVVIAPDYEPRALEILGTKKNLRVIRALGFSYYWDLKKVSGGYLLQEEDTLNWERWEVVSQRMPTQREVKDLEFAFKVCKFAKSNAIVLAKNEQTLAVGTGNTSRVDSLRCAIAKAKRFGFELKGAVMASEAFLPFRDSVDICAQEGITAIVQPGGSIRDKEVISACDDQEIALVFTGTRHFRH